MRARNNGLLSTDGERRLISLEGVAPTLVTAAAAVVGNSVKKTPCVYLKVPNKTHDISFWLKLETATPTGSFKVRGACYFVAQASERAGGNLPDIVTASTGNHGVGLAWACRAMGQTVTVVVPSGIPDLKLKKLQQVGARILIHGDTLDAAFSWARNELASTKHIFAPSYNPDIVLGHSSLGVELFIERKNLKRVFFPMGIGSGMAGLVLARDLYSPQTSLIGVVPESCDAWAKSFLSGAPTTSLPRKTCADGLRTACPDMDVFRFLRSKIENVITVSEQEILAAKKFVEAEVGVVSEGAGVVGLAGLVKFSISEGESNGEVATVLCG